MVFKNVVDKSTSHAHSWCRRSASTSGSLLPAPLEPVVHFPALGDTARIGRHTLLNQGSAYPYGVPLPPAAQPYPTHLYTRLVRSREKPFMHVLQSTVSTIAIIQLIRGVPPPPSRVSLFRREPGIPRPGFVGADPLWGWRQLAMML